MDNDSVNRFRERKRRRAEINARPSATPTSASEEAVLSFLEEAADIDWLASVNESRESHYRVGIDLEVTNAEVESLLGDLRGKVTEREFEVLLRSVKEQVLSSVIKPFGLAKVLFQDKDGGNVTTVQNAGIGVFANEEDRQRWTDWKETQFDRTPYDKGFREHRQKTFKDGLSVRDGYRGTSLDDTSRTHRDHIVSAKELHEHESLGLYFGIDEKVAMATAEINTVYTDGSLNQSKGAQPLREWMATEAESGITNAQRHQVNKLEASLRDLQARAVVQAKVTERVTGRLVQSGIEEGAIMGFQQALGMLLYELADGIMVEVRGLFADWRDRKLPSGLFAQLKARLSSLGARLVAKWDNLVSAFLQGGIAGFVSNLLNFIIDGFKTTLGRIGRIIREGALSLLQAFKLLLFPPEGMTPREAAHESTKILVAGLALAGGLAIEQFVGTAVGMLPGLGFVAGALTSILAGILTGIGTAMVVYAIDKIDFFGVNRDRQHAQVMAELEVMTEKARLESEECLHVFDLPELSPEPM